MDHRRALGALGERLACSHLTARGFEILERNFRTRHGELDVVAASGRYLVFCEVKTRVSRRPGGVFAPLTAVGPAKRLRLRRMAREWLAARGGSLRTRPREIRFDALGVTLTPDGRLLGLEHLEAAF
jgi:putative endonuclease